jgi:hypothetical protein
VPLFMMPTRLSAVNSGVSAKGVDHYDRDVISCGEGFSRNGTYGRRGPLADSGANAPRRSSAVSGMPCHIVARNQCPGA